MINKHALIIAVEDYSIHDRTTGTPKGASEATHAAIEAGADGLTRASGGAKAAPDGKCSVLEIDAGYYVLEYQKSGTWKLLAYVYSDGKTTDFKIDPTGVTNLSAQYPLRLSVSSESAYDESSLPATTPDWSGWGGPYSSPAYPTGSAYLTFAGAYGAGTLAIVIQRSGSSIVTMQWYSPTNQLITVSSNTPIQLASATGNYSGTCYIGTDTFP